MNEYCVLPEQTASYSFCLNDDIIMEGVSVITDTKSCIYDKNKVVEKIQEKQVVVNDEIIDNFEDYYKLLLNI
jgi:uncharacterized protein YkvS